MACKVVGARVRLDFGNHRSLRPLTRATDKERSEEIAGDVERIAVEKGKRKDAAHAVTLRLHADGSKRLPAIRSAREPTLVIVLLGIVALRSGGTTGGVTGGTDGRDALLKNSNSTVLCFHHEKS